MRRASSATGAGKGRVSILTSGLKRAWESVKFSTDCAVAAVAKKKRGPYAGQGAGAQNIRRKRTKLWLRHSFIPEFINLSFYALLPEVLAKIGAFLTPLRFIP
jgi:hypothetical protein